MIDEKKGTDLFLAGDQWTAEPKHCPLNRAHSRIPTEPQNEKTRQKAGFSEVPEMSKAFSEPLYGAGTIEPGTY
ncbi:hypothetical protein [Pseudomonas sp. Irchel 3E13]|jgi:hypothetical protein|uniref:hypothetical protein n=1 Tax=Pseudomonas sp. Irchel 3E13 TaxID=2008975 RepID=UPI00117A639A|nr:hypothetical protein [Pseudomonas sp. Irchel 3E13]